MTSPAIDPSQLEALRAALSAPNMRELLLPTRAPAARTFTYDEARKFVENMVNALDNSPRLPIVVNSTTEPDGSMTIRVTPDVTP